MYPLYDSHYDLLTYILMKQKEPEFLINLCKTIYNPNNVIGGLINAYYMSKEKMKEELNIDTFNSIEHFKIINKIINEYNLLPNRQSFFYSIEGCSYIDIKDLEPLYHLGLRSIIPTYNTDNKYGGGAFGDGNLGLTIEGKKLIDEALRLNIIIDISHLNHKTANDVLDYLLIKKEKGINSIVIASHSNVYALAQRKRNIADEIIKKIGKLDGLIGIVPLKSFCCSEDTNNYDEQFTKHIRYITSLIGIDKVCIASDNMDYHPDKDYQENAIYKIESFATSVYNVLKNYGFSEKEIRLIMQDNFRKKIINKLNENSN